MICQNCKIKLDEGAVFCPECGQKCVIEELEKVEGTKVVEQEENTYCPYCGQANLSSSMFCCACGKGLKEEEIEQSESIGASQKEKSSKKGLKKGIIFAVVATAAIATLGMGVVRLQPKTNNELLYLKDNTLCVGNIKSLKTYEIEDKIIGDLEAGLYKIEELGSYIGYSIDKKYIFYPKFGSDSYEYNLYYKVTDKKDSEEVKIDSEVTRHVLTKDNKIIYTKGVDNNLYVNDLKDKEKLATEIVDFRVSEDGKKVLWTTSDESNMYIRNIDLKEDKVKLDSGISYIVGQSKNFDKVVYMKEGNLYLSKGAEDKVKIASDVESAYTSEDEDELKIVYVKYDSEGSGLKLKDLVYDDCIQEDETIYEPYIGNYQREELQASYWGSYLRTVTDDSYYKDLEIYNEKVARDDLRLSLGYDIYNWGKGELFYYSVATGESVSVKKGYINKSLYYQKQDNKNIIRIFSDVNMDAVEKIKFSNLYNEYGAYASYEVEEKIISRLTENQKFYLQVNDKIAEIDLEAEKFNIGDILIDEQAQCLYLKKADDKGELSALVKLSYGANTFGTIEAVDEDVDYIEKMINGKLYYMKDTDGYSKGDLYCNGKITDYDVEMNTVKESGNGILYITDVSSNEDSGTLKFYDGQKAVKIADDISFYETMENGIVAMLGDYNFEKYKGDLKIHNGKELKTVDTDVTYIIK